MSGKLLATAWSVLHSIGDSIEEKMLLQFNEKQYLFYINLFSGVFSLIIALIGGIELTLLSFLVLVIYALAMIGGDFCYVKAIEKLPIGLANLIDSGGLFIILICDICLGYIKPNFLFLILFLIFFISICIFSNETNKMKDEITNKKIDLKNIFIIITSTIFYASEPYFLKLAVSKGANEYAESLIFYFVAIPIFYYLYKKEKKNISIQKAEKKSFFLNGILLSFIYAITSILSMFAYVDGSPTMITLIMKSQLFLIVIISIIRKTDKMNIKKTVSLIVGALAIMVMTLISE